VVEDAKPRDHVESNAERTMFRELTASNDFYIRAKKEHAGFHRPKLIDQHFFNSCYANCVLPRPVFNCIRDSELRMQGESFRAYTEALAGFIRINQY
jgi:hypothetical protein